ncbi:Transcriptional adapter ADA2 [Sesamum angolense]|uniref:Transcriptional adapter ADA2 n=1 Tax=Sesamum angolense TaxID=2727404 RepID=A0AAE1W3Y0_9LAMI|nr:Transcriptional adapter ADA2 [Sesamum angolense]
MKNMGEADAILGIKLIRSTDGIAISQSHYVEKIIEKFDTLVVLTKPIRGALDRVLKYMNGTVSLVIHYGRFPTVLEGYSDASWIAKNSRSNGCSGYIFTLGGGPVSWKSAKQTLITWSTFEAELCALDTTGTEAEWLFGLLSQLPISLKRKRGTQNVENTESAPPEVPGITDGKKALYHCNYCNKDISGKIRIKCVICSDFDLCIECFSVGAEVHPHKSNHPYRVMDNLAFPLICPDWNADEEMLLLRTCLMMGKNREELLAMAKEQNETKKGATTSGEGDGKAESSFPAGVKVEDQRKDGQAGRSSSSISSEVDTVGGTSCGKISTGGSQKISSEVPSNDGPDAIKVEAYVGQLIIILQNANHELMVLPTNTILSVWVVLDAI